MANIDGSEIKRLRKERGMTLEQMAEASHGPNPVSRSTIIRAERNGVYFARYASIRGIAGALSVSPRDLIKK